MFGQISTRETTKTNAKGEMLVFFMLVATLQNRMRQVKEAKLMQMVNIFKVVIGVHLEHNMSEITVSVEKEAFELA